MYEYSNELLEFVPPEFSIDNYKNTAQFEAVDWWDAFLARDKVDIWLSQNYIKEAKEDNLENIKQGAVKSLYIYERDLKPVDTTEKKLYDFLAKEEPIASCRFATINVKIPDDVLVKHFLDWVSGERLKLGVEAPKKVITDSHFRRWHEARILQYMDVRQWHKINNLTPKNVAVILGSVIYPDNAEGNHESKMKTTRKHLKQLESKGYRSALTAMVHSIQRNEKT